MASGTIPSRPAKPHPDRLKIMHLFPDRPLASLPVRSDRNGDMIRRCISEDEHERAQRAGDHEEGFSDGCVGRQAKSAESKRQQGEESAGAESDETSHLFSSEVMGQRIRLSGVPHRASDETSGFLRWCKKRPAYLNGPHTSHAGVPCRTLMLTEEASPERNSAFALALFACVGIEPIFE
jgi:hypothetical protein